MNSSFNAMRTNSDQRNHMNTSDRYIRQIAQKGFNVFKVSNFLANNKLLQFKSYTVFLVLEFGEHSNVCTIFILIK